MARGFDGSLFDRAGLEAYLKGTRPPKWVKALIVHCVSRPNLAQVRATTTSPDPKVDAAQRDKNFWGEVQKRLYGKGWHFSVFEGGWIGDGQNVMLPGVHAGTRNPDTLGAEMVMDGDSDDVESVAGQQIIDTTAFLFARLLTWLGLPADETTILYHREEASAKKKGKSCPGKRMEPKAAFIKRVKAYMGEPVAEVPTPKADYIDAIEMQTRLKIHGFDPGPIDGIVGPRTTGALKEFQKLIGVNPTGKAGAWTATKLRAEPARPVVVVLPTPAPKPPAAPPAAPSKPLTNPEIAMQILTAELGWPRHWAAGAIAQAQRESYPRLDPLAAGDYFLDGKPSKRGVKGAVPTAFGIWQHRNERLTARDAFAKSIGLEGTDFRAQVLFMPHELKTSEKLAWKWLQLAETVEQATAAMVWYERPKGYISKDAKAATTWAEVFAVSEKCDGYKERLAFARALM